MTDQQREARLDSFEQAFSARAGSLARVCDCGKQFYNPDKGWDFDPGELEKYEADPQAQPLDVRLLAAQRMHGHYELQSLTFERVPDDG